MAYCEVAWILMGLCTLIDVPGSLTSGVTLTLKPDNTAVLDSNTVIFKCQVTQASALTSFISWEECITIGDGTCRRISNDETKVYTTVGGDATRGARYSVANINSEPGRYDLTITGIVQAEDAGVYRCMSRNDATALAYARLTILASNPSCTSNITEHMNKEPVDPITVQAECKVNFNGPLAPVTSFSVREDDGTLIREEVGTDKSSAGISKYSIVYTPKQGDHSKYFRADTYFKPPTDGIADMATNAPSYTFINRIGQLTGHAPNVRYSTLLVTLAGLTHFIATNF